MVYEFGGGSKFALSHCVGQWITVPAVVKPAREEEDVFEFMR